MIPEDHKKLQVEIDLIVRELKMERITPEIARLRLDAIKHALKIQSMDHERSMMVARLERKAPSEK